MFENNRKSPARKNCNPPLTLAPIIIIKVLWDVFKTSSRCLARCLQDFFKTYLQDDFKPSSRHVFKTSWKKKNCYTKDMLRTSSRRVLKTSSRRLEDQLMFAGMLPSKWGNLSLFSTKLVFFYRKLPLALDCRQSKCSL